MFQSMFQLLKRFSKKRDNPPADLKDEDNASSQPSSDRRKSIKTKVLALSVMLAVFALSFIVSYRIFFNQTDSYVKQAGKTLVSHGLQPVAPPGPAGENANHTAAAPPEQTNTTVPTANPASRQPGQSVNAGQRAPASLPAARQVKAEKKTIPEYDPFKSEFKRKYAKAEENSNSSGKTLKQLENAIKPSTTPSMPLMPNKKFELAVYGVFQSGNDIQAITNKGVLEKGDTLDNYVVERISLDSVTFVNELNVSDAHTVFVGGAANAKNQGQAPERFPFPSAPAIMPR